VQIVCKTLSHHKRAGELAQGVGLEFKPQYWKKKKKKKKKKARKEKQVPLRDRYQWEAFG
jgi:hypothetical protein